MTAIAKTVDTKIINSLQILNTTEKKCYWQLQKPL